MEPQELKTFSAEALANFQATSAVAPSSRYLIRAMLAPLPLARARTVVEFGPGTGAITRALLDALPRQATLYSFEISPRFRDYLRQKLADPRLVVIDKEQGGKADALNAGLNLCWTPWVCTVDADSIMEEDSLLRALRPALEDDLVVASSGIVRIANGKIVEHWGVEDAIGIMQQLGLMPGPGAN